jgi:hypothetical protein
MKDIYDYAYADRRKITEPSRKHWRRALDFVDLSSGSLQGDFAYNSRFIESTNDDSSTKPHCSRASSAVPYTGRPRHPVHTETRDRGHVELAARRGRR